MRKSKWFVALLIVFFACSAFALGNANDLAYLNYSELQEVVGVGATDEIIIMEAGIPKQGATVADVQNSPVTTQGDLVLGDASGDADRLAVGAAGEVLGSDGTDPVWTSGVYSAQVAVSLVELNADKIIVAAVTGKQILVLDFNIVMDGSFGTLTSAELEDSSGTINVCSMAQAQMTDNAVLSKDTTGVTMGVGLAEGLTISESLDITVTGSDADTATGLTVAVTYMLV